MEFGSEQVTGVVDEHARKRTIFNMIQSYGCRSKVFLPREFWMVSLVSFEKGNIQDGFIGTIFLTQDGKQPWKMVAH